MDTIGQRIRIIRNSSVEKSQKNFGAKIGLKPNSISDIETGKNTPTDQTIKAICREFGINEEWLRTGKGKMNIEDSEEIYSINIAKLQRTDNETIIRWVNAIAETNPELLKEIETFMKKILNIE